VLIPDIVELGHVSITLYCCFGVR